MKKQPPLVDRLSRKPAVEKVSIASRLDPAVHAALAEAASASGRSISEEVERRITASVTAKNTLAAMFGSPGTVRLMEGFGRLFDVLELDLLDDWRANPDAAALAFAAFHRFLTIALVEDPGHPPYEPAAPRNLLTGTSGDVIDDDAHATAELVARAMRYKSKAPRPEAELQNLIAWLSEHDPKALEKLRANYSEPLAQMRALRSASGPQEKSTSKKTRSKST